MPGPRPILGESEAAALVAKEQRISADSHFGEPPDLWEQRLPERFRDRALRFPKITLYETNHHLRAGSWDPHERLKDLALDGVSAEVLYPTLGKEAWLLEDHDLAEACIQVYNDWEMEFCSVAPERFWGLAMLSIWDIDRAVAEMERCKRGGLRGVDLPMSPPLDLPYSSERYEKLWAAAEALDLPVSMHINSGTGRISADRSGLLPYGVHKFDSMKTLGDLVGAGVMERHPQLKFVIAEGGSGWIPFFAQEYDYYLMSGPARRNVLPQPPSEYLYRQVFTTFIGDRVAGSLADEYGKDNFMWSTDYPHPACTWPHSGFIIAQDLGHLDPDVRGNIIRNTAARLYNGGQLPPPADPSTGDHQPLDTWNLSMRTPEQSAGWVRAN